MIAQNTGPRANKSIQKLELLSQQLLEKQGLGSRYEPGERDFVSTSSRSIYNIFQKLFAEAGVEPPARATIRDWFYGSCPSWAIATLNSYLKE